MALTERDVKFFRPLWIRLLVTGVVVVWFLLETVLSHDPLWIGITAIGVLYCIWNFFLRFPKEIPAETAPAGAAAPSVPPEPGKQP